MADVQLGAYLEGRDAGRLGGIAEAEAALRARGRASHPQHARCAVCDAFEVAADVVRALAEESTDGR